MNTIASSSSAAKFTPASVKMAGSSAALKIDRVVRGDEMKAVYGPGMSIIDVPENLLELFMNFPQVGHMTSASTIKEREGGSVHLPARKDVYATIENTTGESVASISNEGAVEITDIASARLRAAVDDRSLYAGTAGKSGPELAQILAHRIAGIESGDVVKSETALTQSHFEALSSGSAGWQDMSAVDYLALRQSSRLDIYDNARAEMLRRSHK